MKFLTTIESHDQNENFSPKIILPQFFLRMAYFHPSLYCGSYAGLLFRSLFHLPHSVSYLKTPPGGEFGVLSNELIAKCCLLDGVDGGVKYLLKPVGGGGLKNWIWNCYFIFLIIFVNCYHENAQILRLGKWQELLNRTNMFFFIWAAQLNILTKI